MEGAAREIGYKQEPKNKRDSGRKHTREQNKSNRIKLLV